MVSSSRPFAVFSVARDEFAEMLYALWAFIMADDSARREANRRAVALCCLAAITESAASVLVDLHVIEWGRIIAQALFLLNRSTATILALTLLTVQWFIAWETAA